MPTVKPNPAAPLIDQPYPPIYDAFLQQARQTPQSVALDSDFGDCTYESLEKISRLVATCLQMGGLTPKGGRVAILSDRNPALVYAMLGVLRSGAAFSITDYAYPTARIIKNLELVQPDAILICGDISLSGELLAFCNQQKSLTIIKIPALAKAAMESLGRFAANHLNDHVVADEIAYFTFTSGSTGQPKAVVTSHRPLVHFIEWHVRQHGFTAEDRFSMLSGLSHDPLLRDIFTPLSIGATLCIPSQATIFDPNTLFAWLTQNKISVCHLTPALGEIICAGADKNNHALNCLRFMFWGGDILSLKTSQRISEVAPKARQVNFYGTTETPQAVGYFTITTGTRNRTFPIGCGIVDTQLLIITEKNKLAEIGELGEIWVRTPYLSRGYLNDPAQTQSRFVPNPFSDSAADICYRTGDLGKYVEEGHVIFAGRIDHQIKIRGFRVEPAEIVQTIEAFEHITHAAVIAIDSDSGSKKLAAYYTSADGVQLDNTEVLQYLQTQFPAYMVPTYLVPIKAFPLLPNGKIDLQALPDPMPTDEEVELSGPCTEVERLLLEQMQKHVDFYVPDVAKSYADFGGDSLSYIRVSMAIENTLGWLPDNWDKLPISDLAKLKEDTRQNKQSMSTAVLARAISIMVIVFVHNKVIGQVGMTSALFVLAGWSFGRYQLNSIYKAQSTQSVWLLIAKIAFPAALFVLAQQYLINSPHLSSLLFLDNFVDPSNDLQRQYRYYWFINVLLQILVFIAVLFAIKPLRNYAYQHPFAFGLQGVALSIVLAFIGIYAWDTYLIGYVQPTANYGISQLPHLKLWLFFLGIAIASTNTLKQKHLLVALVAILYLVTHFIVKTPVYITLTSVPLVMLIIMKDTIKVPAKLTPVISNIAGASLFIYLGDKAVRLYVKTHMAPINPLLVGIVTVILSILLWHAWEFLIRHARNMASVLLLRCRLLSSGPK
jgi:amino acid adenylation domain-containing protein